MESELPRVTEAKTMSGTAAGAAKRRRYGKRPGRAHEVLAESSDGWTLYEILFDEVDVAKWINCKLIHSGRRGKANYWFGWDIPNARFSRRRDIDILLEHDPAVYAWLLTKLDPDTYGLMA